VTVTAISHGTVVTMDAANTVIPNGQILIEDEHLASVGTYDVATAARADQEIDAAGRIVLPGFVNAHTHSSQSLLRGGVSHSRRLYDWVVDVLMRGLAQYTESDYRIATTLYAAEAIRAGITCILTNEEPLTDDPLDGASAVLDTFADTGLRVIYGLMFRDAVQAGVDEHVPRAAELPITADEQRTFDLLDRLHHERHATAGGRIAIWPSPATTATVSPATFRRSDQWAAAHGVSWTMHLAEVADEAAMRPESPVRFLHDAGALSSRLVGAHAVHVDTADIRLLAEARARVVTNPVSNAYLASGIAPLPALLAAGITVGFGTDDANCNDSINPLGDLKVCALLHRAVTSDPAAISPSALLRMATQGGADAIGYGSQIGSLEPGKIADVVLITTRVPQLCPIHDPVAALVFQAYGSEVETVFIAGERVLDQGVLRFAPDIEALCTQAQQASERIITEGGIPRTPILR
jgi:cytosine/adenosine deaminase-related metal-dependent hydrolase